MPIWQIKTTFFGVLLATFASACTSAQGPTSSGGLISEALLRGTNERLQTFDISVRDAFHLSAESYFRGQIVDDVIPLLVDAGFDCVQRSCAFVRTSTISAFESYFTPSPNGQEVTVQHQYTIHFTGSVVQGYRGLTSDIRRLEND